MISTQSVLFFFSAFIACLVVAIVKIFRRDRSKFAQVRRIILFYTFISSICGVIAVTLLPIETLFIREFPTISINYIPFSTISSYFSSTSDVGSIAHELTAWNFFGNIAIFLPFGFLSGMLFARCQKLHYLLIFSALFSLTIELAQLLEQVLNLVISRATDIDDIILNVLGATIGFAIYKLLFSHSNERFLASYYAYRL